MDTYTTAYGLYQRLGREFNSTVVRAKTPHGTYVFNITEVSNEDGFVMLHLEEVKPEPPLPTKDDLVATIQRCAAALANGSHQ